MGIYKQDKDNIHLELASADKGVYPNAIPLNHASPLGCVKLLFHVWMNILESKLEESHAQTFELIYIVKSCRYGSVINAELRGYRRGN